MLGIHDLIHYQFFYLKHLFQYIVSSMRMQFSSVYIPKKVFPSKVLLLRNKEASMFKWRDPQSLQTFFLKGYSLDYLDSKEKYKIVFHNEGHINSIMSDYKLFPTFHGMYIEDHYPPERAFLMSEFIAGSNVDQLLRSSGRFDEEYALPIMRDMATFVYACHSRGVIHRDIKLMNFMLQHETHRTFGIDMGFSKVLLRNDSGKPISPLLYQQHHFYICGTPVYMAPEIMMGGPYTASIDVWALGICFYQLLYGTNPIHSKSESFIDLKNVDHLKQAYDRCHKSFVLDDVQVSSHLNVMIKRMLDPDSERRLTIDEVVKWIQ